MVLNACLLLLLAPPPPLKQVGYHALRSVPKRFLEMPHFSYYFTPRLSPVSETELSLAMVQTLQLYQSYPSASGNNHTRGSPREG